MSFPFCLSQIIPLDVIYTIIYQLEALLSTSRVIKICCGTLCLVEWDRTTCDIYPARENKQPIALSSSSSSSSSPYYVIQNNDIFDFINLAFENKNRLSYFFNIYFNMLVVTSASSHMHVLLILSSLIIQMKGTHLSTLY